MITRALLIIEGLIGTVPAPAGLQRIAAAFIPDDVEVITLTNEEKAAYFVRGVRDMVKKRILSSEERAAINAAIEAVRADVETGVDIGSD